MRRYVTRYILGVTALVCTPVCAQQAAAPLARFSPAGDSLQLRLALSEAARGVGRDYAVTVTPAVVSPAGDTLRLAPVTFRAARNQRLTARGRHFGTAPAATWAECALGDTVLLSPALSLAAHPWLASGRCRVTALREREGCCRVEALPEQALGAFAYVPPFVPALAPVAERQGRAGELAKENPALRHISTYAPYDATRALSREEGVLYVHFPVDGSTLLPAFRDNAPTLERIVYLTRQILADTTSTVRRIQVIGLASIEGRLAHNRQLSARRAAALQRYFAAQTGAADSLFECTAGGEAWAEMRLQIAESSVAQREALLSIIDTEADPDRRERRLRTLAGGAPWRTLRDELLPLQRNSGYLRIYYDYVPDPAAAIINGASDLLRQGRAAEALAQLETVQRDERAQNALGCARYMLGQRERALAHFRRAVQFGSPEAAENLRRCEQIARAQQAADAPTQ